MKTLLRGHRYALVDTLTRIARQPLSVLLNILVVGIALALPLAGFTLLTGLKPLTGRLADSAEVSVYLHTDTTRAEAQALGSRLRALPDVARADFIPREAALEQLKAQAGLNQAIAALESNPLPDAWVLRLGAEAGTERSAAAVQDRLARELRQLPGVEHVQVDSDWMRRMEALLRFLGIGLSILAAALGVAVIAVVFNTIRLQVTTQRDEIAVARLVGATDGFIQRPFYYMGALQGTAGGLLALGLVTLTLIPLNDGVGAFARLYGVSFGFTPLPPLWMGGFVLTTAALGWFGAILSVTRHLSRTARSALI